MNLWWIQLLCLAYYTVNGADDECADANEHWSYREKNGPKTWGEEYPMCNGQQQSPIDIQTKDAISNSSLPKLVLKNYNKPVTKATVANNGHTIQVTPSDGVERSISVNGDTYKLAQFHFHWGNTADRGSEHTIDGKQYSMELHFVHLNDKKEIAVVGVFFKQQTKSNSELKKIISEFPNVMYKNTKSDLKSSIKLNGLLPANPSSYYRYQGSLTTPNCAQGVTWSVLVSPIAVGNDQIAEYRKLYSVEKADASPNCTLTDNYRPVQPLNGRKVYRSK